MTTATASAWRVRHEGSPKSIDDLTLQDVAVGLEEGRWEPTDEVRGPQDTAWVAIENHPQLEEVAADLEPPPPRDHGDHSHIDMTALIDVCLVLLVFFILTTSYAALMKSLEAPGVSDQPVLKPLTRSDAEKFSVSVVVKKDGDKVVYLVEGQPVDSEMLVGELKRRVGSTQKTVLLLEYDGEVPHRDVVKVHDAANGAGMTKVMDVLPKSK